MTALLRASYSVETSGLLKFSKQFDVNSDSNGYTIDLSEIQFEDRTGVTNFVKMINTGVRAVWILFDDHHDSININDTNTFNLKVNAGQGYNAISLAGQCSKISMKSEPDVINPMMVIVI